jgi:hypothetical protein
VPAGGIGGAGVPAFKSAMAAALKEFFNSADAQEVAARSVWSLPVFGIQIRIQAVQLALCAGGFEYAPAALLSALRC